MRFGVLFLTLFSVTAFGGHQLSNVRLRFCLKQILVQGMMHTLPALPYIPRATEYPHALHKAGTHLGPGVDFTPEQLRDGIYIYLVVRSGRKEHVIWSMRAPGASQTEPEKNLALHDSLYETAKGELGGDPEVIAGGQVWINNDVASRIDNRSWTRRGGALRLAYGESVLANKGLPIVDNGQVQTQRLDFSKVPEGAEGKRANTNPDYDHHAEAERLADYRVAIDASENLSKVRAAVLKTHRKIHAEHPELRHPTIPGFLDMDKLFPMERIEEAADSDDPKFTRMWTVAFRTMRAMQREGIELATTEAHFKGSSDAFESGMAAAVAAATANIP